MDVVEVTRWLAGLAEFDAYNVRHLLAMFALFGLPDSYLDVGSGTGAMVRAARQLGVEAWGVDRLPRPESWLLERDLAEPLDLQAQYRIVSCIEVAEHLPNQATEQLCFTLARHVRLGGILIFTAALPGQQGDGHQVLQPPVWWRERLTQQGLTYCHGLTVKLALLWSNIWTPLGHLPANLQVFSRGTPDLPSGVGA